MAYCKGWPLDVEQALTGGMQGAVLHEHDPIRDLCEVRQGQQCVEALHYHLSALVRPEESFEQSFEQSFELSSETSVR